MKITKNQSLKPYNTFGIDAQANAFLILDSPNDLVQFSAKFTQLPTPIYFLGGGANTLFVSNFSGTIVHIDFKGIAVVEVFDETVLLAVKAGEAWDDFVSYCVARNYYGIENLVAIPGSVGAAPIQNIGAYGVEAKDVIEEVHFWHLPSASMRSLTKTDCQFDYRNSIFKNELKDQCIITEVVFRLEKKADFKLGYGSLHAELVKRNIVSPSLKDIAEIIRTVRESKLPDVKEIGNAGSFFKNPIVSASHLKKLQTKYPNIVFYPLDNGEVKLAAGWLIEHAGLKGFQIGGAAVHEQQALVIINKNGATGPDVVALSTHIQKVILQLYDVQLSPEVIFV